VSIGKIIMTGCAWGVVYGIMNGISNTALLPSAPFISIRPQIALPIVMGIIAHPVAGFLVGFTGNVIGDGISGFGLWKFWNWHLANGLIGFLPGMIRYFGIGKITTVRDFGILEMGVILASGVSVGIAVLLDYFFLHFMKFPESFPSWILPAFLTDSVNGFILVPVLLMMTGRLILTLEIRTITLITALLVMAILSTAVSTTWSVRDDLVSTEAMIEIFYLSGIVSVLIIFAGFIASIAFVRRITDPLSRLTRAAEDVEKGIYELKPLDPISRRNDELGQLSRVLQAMAEQVRTRENRLLLQVQELQIKIDLDRKAREVAEIVETEYFKTLKKKAREFRSS